jgi:hypothetical protein
MADDDVVTAEDIEGLVPPEVRQILAEEGEFIAARVRAAQGSWDRIIASGLTWLPYVGDVFDENRINTAAATSDVSRDGRVTVVVAKMEHALGTRLSANTVESVKRLIYDMYNSDIDLDD